MIAPIDSRDGLDTSRRGSDISVALADAAALALLVRAATFRAETSMNVSAKRANGKRRRLG